jgi:hypothetical protein
MTLPEVFFRVGRRLSQERERRRVVQGWRPGPATARPGLPLFPVEGEWPSLWQSQYALDEEGMELLLRGEVDFFGNPPLSVGVPVKWNRDPFTGRTAPRGYGKSIDYRNNEQVGDIKYLWELGRHQHLVPLAVAYAVSGEERYRKNGVLQIEGFIAANPFGRGVHWCSSLEVGFRLISWAFVHSLLCLRDGPSGLFGAVADPATLGRSIYEHGWFIRNFLSRHSSANNHLIGELMGLWVGLTAFDCGEQGAAWRAFAKAGLEREARQQNHADGVNKEQALHYHLWVLESLLLSWAVGQRSGSPFSGEFGEIIGKMAGFLRDLSAEGGIPPQIGDADEGVVTRFEPRWVEQPFKEVLTAERLIKGAGFEGPLPQKGFFYGAIAGAAINLQDGPRISPVPTDYPRVYATGGYGILGDRRVRVVFRAGPFGYLSIAAHSHADLLSFCMGLGRDWWFIDPGTYVYHTERRWRDYFRGTSAHNTVRLDGKDQAENRGSFLWLNHAQGRLENWGGARDTLQWISGSHDGYERIRVRHERRIEYDPRETRLSVQDNLTGAGEHLVELFFHIAPEVRVEEIGSGRFLLAWDGRPWTVTLSCDPGFSWMVVRGDETGPLGWHSRRLGHRAPTITVRGIRKGELPMRARTEISIQESVTKEWSVHDKKQERANP